MATAAELRAEHARLRAEQLKADQAWRAEQDKVNDRPQPTTR